VAEGVETTQMLRDVKHPGIGLVQESITITTHPIPFSRPNDGWIFAGNGAALLARAQA
jgi:hypothetical protein